MLFSLVINKLLRLLGFKKCYFCNQITHRSYRIAVDAEADHDGDNWYTSIIYDTVPLCREHLEAYENGDLDLT